MIAHTPAQRQHDFTKLKRELQNTGKLSWDGGNTPTYASGFAELDQRLPGGGLPLGALSELFLPQLGSAEWLLLAPLLRRITAHARAMLIAPPWPVNPVALRAHSIALENLWFFDPPAQTQTQRSAHRDAETARDAHWLAEQCLRQNSHSNSEAIVPNPGAGREALTSNHFQLVTVWSQSIDERGLKRLQLAAEAGGGLALICRPLSALNTLSPAALRISLRSTERQVQLQVHKCRAAPWLSSARA